MRLAVRSVAAWLAGATLLAACASAPPRPDDVSAAERERTAAEELHQAQEERASYDPHAIHSVVQCRSEGRECEFLAFNPTEIHLDDAVDDEAEAAAQLAMARTLRDAEAKACAGLPESAHARSPFHPPATIVSVTPLGSADSPQGAAIVLREPPGFTRAELEQRVACHLAYTAALGHVAPEMPDCPLVPRAQVDVLPDGAGFVVFLRGEDRAASTEIVRRARALLR